MKLYFIFIFLLVCSFNASSQTFERCFKGEWAATAWFFEFYKDGTFRRTSKGHYGSGTQKGTYQIEKDSIRILSGYKNTDGTISSIYSMNKDSTQLRDKNNYPYVQIPGIVLQFGQPYEAKYPFMPTQSEQTKQEIKQAFKVIFQEKEIANLLLRQKPALKSLKIIDFYELNHKNQWNLQLKTILLYFVPKADINENEPYIEIAGLDIEDTNSMLIGFYIHNTQQGRISVSMSLFKKENKNRWQVDYQNIE